MQGRSPFGRHRDSGLSRSPGHDRSVASRRPIAASSTGRGAAAVGSSGTTYFNGGYREHCFPQFKTVFGRLREWTSTTARLWNPYRKLLIRTVKVFENCTGTPAELENDRGIAWSVVRRHEDASTVSAAGGRPSQLRPRVGLTAGRSSNYVGAVATSYHGRRSVDGRRRDHRRRSNTVRRYSLTTTRSSCWRPCPHFL